MCDIIEAVPGTDAAAAKGRTVMKRSEFMYMGHPSQKYHAETHMLVDGKGAGMRLVEIENGKGLHVTLCPDRCLDITRLSFEGVNCGYFSGAGYVSPVYYDDRGANFLRSFTAGFMTTCGLRNAGIPSEIGTESFGLHGRIGHTPAESWSVRIDEVPEGDDIIRVEGVMRETHPFAERLSLRRRIEVLTDQNVIRIHDTVVNEGTKDEPVMLLYHCNVGYPLLDESAVLDIDSLEVKPRNAHAASGLADWAKMQPPTLGFSEMCYYHDIKADAQGMRKATLYNPTLKKGVTLTFNLPRMVEWKMMNQQGYVVGLEPTNCTLDGRQNAIDKGELDVLKPGESIWYTVEIALFNGEK